MKSYVYLIIPDVNPPISEGKLNNCIEKLSIYTSVHVRKSNDTFYNRLYNSFFRRFSEMAIYLVSDQNGAEGDTEELRAARKIHLPIVRVDVDKLESMNEEQVYLFLLDMERKTRPVLLFFVLSIIACLCLCYAGITISYKVASHLVSDKNSNLLEARGLFGDSWGGVNAIISAFAFAGVIVTLYLQNRDLNLQRKEMARQRDEFEKENETLKCQRFDNLFYNMLNLQQRIVDGLHMKYHRPRAFPNNGEMANEELKGREVFRLLYEVKKGQYFDERDKELNGLKSYITKYGIQAYNEYSYTSIFDHYFRHLYKILQFVEKQEISRAKAYEYASFLRGTLSRYELVWIYYNGLQYPKLKVLIEDFSLLKNIRVELLALSNEARSFFEELGINESVMGEENLPYNDYIFFMTDNPEVKDKYHLSAFYSSADMEEGRKYYNKWPELINRIGHGLSEIDHNCD